MASNPQIKAVITAEDRASATLSKFGNNVNGVSSKISKGLKLAAIGVAAAGTAAVAFGVSSVKSFQESEKATAQLNAVLKSTKGAAGVSAKAATDLADKLSRLNAVDDEAVLGAENMLLTFTNIGKNIFPQTTQAAIDMATAMNGGAIPSAEQLRNTTIQLGKALQSPDAGLGALKRVGVNVDELKKKFTESMTVQEKQKLILKELATEFGGSGAAAANTYAGKMNLIKIAFENLKEKIGLAILNGFNPLMTKLAEFVASDQFQAWITKLTTWLQVNLPIAINYVTNTLIPNLINIFNAVWPVVRTVIEWLGKFINFLADHEIALWTFIGVIGVMKAAFFMGNVVRSFKASLATIRGAYALTSGVLSIPIPITILVGAALIAMGLIIAKAKETIGVLDQLGQAQRMQGSSFDSATRGLRDLAKSGTPAQRARAKRILANPSYYSQKANASGTDFFGGGQTLVGERGPEMVTLPRGSKVARADETRRMMGGSTTINISVQAGAFMGSQQDARKYSVIIAQALKDYANMNGTTVNAILGG